MKRPQRKSTLSFERMESRCLLSAGMPVLTTATYDKLVKEVKAAVTSAAASEGRPVLVGSLEHLAESVPHGKADLLPFWKMVANSVPLNSMEHARTLQHELVATLDDDIQDSVAFGLFKFTGSASTSVSTPVPAPVLFRGPVPCRDPVPNRPLVRKARLVLFPHGFSTTASISPYPAPISSTTSARY